MTGGMSAQLHVEASVHRLWYFPGDTVRCRVLLCSELAVSCPKVSRLIPLSLKIPASASTNNNGDDKCLSAYVVPVVCSLHAVVQGVGIVDSSQLSLESVSTVPLTSAGAKKAGKERKTAVLLRSPSWALMEEAHVSGTWPVVLYFTFCLPDNLPPSYVGHAVRFQYEICLRARWHLQQSGESVEGDERLTVPLTVFAAVPSVLPIFLSKSLCSLQSVDEHSSIPLEHSFDFKLCILTDVPSRSVSAPLTDALVPRDVQRCTPHRVHRAALLGLHDLLSGRSTPFSYTLSLNGRDALLVTLQSCTVRLGTHIQGALLPIPVSAEDKSRAPGSEDRSIPRVIKVEGILEVLECCRRQVSRVPGARSVPGMGHLVILSSKLVEYREWVLLDAINTPFSFPLSPSYMYATLLSDIVTVLWQLTLKFVWSTSGAVANTSRPGCQVMEVQRDSPQLVVPLTVVPPRTPEMPRVGPTHSCAERYRNLL